MFSRLLIAAVLVAAACLPPAGATDFDLGAYRGKVVYLDFWASWCGPCRQSFPWLGGLVSQYARRDLVVIAVNLDQDRSKAERFLGATPAKFPVIFDPQGQIATAYKVSGMPSAVLIDRGGHVRFQHVGFSEKQKESYEQQLQSLLAEDAR